MKKFFTLVLATVLAMVPCTLSAQKIKVACLGNSITAGAGISNEADKYPSQLQNLLGDGYEVRNFGQNSQTVQMRGYDLTDGSKPGDCAYRNKQTYKNALAYKPDIVVLKLGTNDSKNINWLEDSPVVFRKDLNDMLDEIVANSNPTIYLCYPLRVKSSSWTINERNIHTIIGIIKSVAEERGISVINLHTAFDEQLGDKWNTVYADGVHPNAEGAKIIAQYVADAILNNKFNDSSTYLHPTVACIGGLRTSGYDGGLASDTRSTDVYTYQLGLELGTRYTVTNYGVGNRTILREGTEQDPAKTTDPKPCSYLNHNKYQEVVKGAYDIVTIHLGEMDAKSFNWAHKDDFKTDLSDMVNGIREASPDTKVYICVPARLKNNATFNNIDGNVYADEVAPAMRSVAATLNVPVVDFADAFEDRDEYYANAFALKAPAHKLMAQTLAKKILDDEKDWNTSINTIVADSGAEDGSVEYYDLSGVSVSNPSAGLYIRRQGSSVSKVVVR